MLALGLIETKGLIGAIEAADAMLKAANVRLLEKSLATGGLVTITIAGEVAAVQSAVDAASASLDRIEGVVCVSRHVIPRPDAGLEQMLLLQPVEPKAQEPVREAAVSGTQAEKFTAEPAKATDSATATEKASTAEEAKTATVQPRTEATGFSREKCKTMSMNKLRQLAVEMKVDLTREQVASANRQTLIDAIDRAARKEKE